MSELPATMSENMTARHSIVLTTLRASSTAVMMILMTMLLMLTTIDSRIEVISRSVILTNGFLSHSKFG